jgi:hypothetical protein
MTLVEARVILKPHGITLNRQHGEYRVAFRLPYRTKQQGRAFDPEKTAYYTNDLDDAVGTGLAMAQGVPGGNYGKAGGRV